MLTTYMYHNMADMQANVTQSTYIFSQGFTPHTCVRTIMHTLKRAAG